MSDPLAKRIKHGLLNTLGQIVCNAAEKVADKAGTHAAKGLRRTRDEARKTKRTWDRIAETLDNVVGDE